MALTATIYSFSVQLSDVDRGIYEAISFKAAQHPSETAEHLIALQPEMRVLFMSRVDYSRVARRLEINRDLGFLQKPFTMVQIANKVRRALDAGRPRSLTVVA